LTYRREPAAKLARIMGDLVAESVFGESARSLIVAAMTEIRGLA
jgi:ubiquinone biosynthesis protein UbiJ